MVVHASPVYLAVIVLNEQILEGSHTARLIENPPPRTFDLQNCVSIG